MAFFKRSEPRDYVADFDEFYTRLVQTGPAKSGEVASWAGDAPFPSAKALAIEWRVAELEDVEDAAKLPNSYYMKIIAFKSCAARIQTEGESRAAYLKLGEQLFVAGALNAPYDENLSDDPKNEWGSSPGRHRLYALMYLAVIASDLRHPRAGEWYSLGNQALASTPDPEVTSGLMDWWSRRSSR